MILTDDEEAILDAIATEQLERTSQDPSFRGLTLEDLHFWLELGGTKRSMKEAETVISSLRKKELIQKIAGKYWVTEKGEIVWSQTAGGTFGTAAIDFVRFQHPELTEEVKKIGYDIPPTPSRN